MNISAVVPSYAHAGRGHGVHANRLVEDAAEHMHGVEKLSETVEENTAPREAAAVDDRQKGVLGLLQANHFKGVAAVRLAINFHVELSGQQQEAVQSRAGEAVASLHEKVTHALEAFPEESSEVQVQEIRAAQGEFSESIRSLLQDFRNGDLTQETLAGGISGIFDGLAARVRSALEVTPPVSNETEIPESGNVAVPAAEVAQVVADTAPAEGGLSQAAVTGPADSELYIANLQQVFSAALSSMQAELAAVIEMPEFQAPNGNGGAFEKFLGIYRDLFDMVADAEARVTDEPVSIMTVDEQV